ncbi:MAG: plasmid pRiA4b ORF-3 family protein, partial [Tissierellia bacterium]|nr:plasmid pRiA4b ORF-3 family protein [Tissierellia bacterium]
MKKNIGSTKNAITPVRLHLELRDDYLSDYQKRMLRRYGESNSGESITRDILIPSDMPLHNLHYAIQKLFGWQNSHLRSFYLPEEIYSILTGGTVKGWTDLVGILFQPPSEAEEDVFWDDDYERGSFKVWLKKKYTGPYIYGGIMEHPEIARQDVQELLEHFKMIEVRESFVDYMERADQAENAETKIIKKAPLIDLTLEEMNTSIMIEGGTESLLERLEVNKVLAAQGEDVDSNELFPVTKELIYNYDFGDNWIVKITKYKDCE